LLGTAFFMVILDGTIVFVALPTIQEALGFSTPALQWVISAYLLCFGGFLLLGGRTGDLLGRRRMFMLGVALFAASSLVCGFASSEATLIGARAVQGVSAAVMAPTALALLMTVFPEGPDRNKALGILGRDWGHRGDGRAPDRRSRDRVFGLGVDLLHQRSRRARPSRADAALAS
jgi:MFS family permease